MQRLVFAIITVALAYNLASTLCCSGSDVLAGSQSSNSPALSISAMYSHLGAAVCFPANQSNDLPDTEISPASHFVAPGGDDDLTLECPLPPCGNSSPPLAGAAPDPAAIAPGGDDDLPLSL
jgi:hypothetical protein